MDAWKEVMQISKEKKLKSDLTKRRRRARSKMDEKKFIKDM